VYECDYTMPHTVLVDISYVFVNNMQMMHGSECDEPEVENVARGHSPSATFLTKVHHI